MWKAWAIITNLCAYVINYGSNQSSTFPLWNILKEDESWDSDITDVGNNVVSR